MFVDGQAVLTYRRLVQPDNAADVCERGIGQSMRKAIVDGCGVAVLV